ncbi:MAG: hypothetical protein DI565_08100 [Ancylobacter novellus]|uniref:DUF2189 domain-containing protein n=1 Tax=Ancylobacter novellus TaxID=921 RepID=A0A2W5MEC1_ANCNO|nr:MAG: hypothetical protein DI565_08100 [Ancylobacter novellus]
MTIRNPVEWSADGVAAAVDSVRETAHAMRRPMGAYDERPIALRRIGFSDLGDALREGLDDFAHLRSDVFAIALIYPLAGLVIATIAFNASLLHLLFPMVAGFALLGPFAAIGLYEASRRREAGLRARWSNMIDAFVSPAAAAIWTLGLILTALYLAWLLCAWALHAAIMGPDLPTSSTAFANEILTTPRGWTMILVGCGVGAGFAVAALSISVISFPLLLDRKVTVGRAIETSVRAVRENPAVMLGWGAIVAGSLALGAAPALLGLIVVMPVLGHATWRLYRKIVV